MCVCVGPSGFIVDLSNRDRDTLTVNMIRIMTESFQRNSIKHQRDTKTHKDITADPLETQLKVAERQ